MHLDGRRGDPEPIGDLLVRQALREQLQDVELAVGQGLERCAVRGWRDIGESSIVAAPGGRAVERGGRGSHVARSRTQTSTRPTRPRIGIIEEWRRRVHSSGPRPSLDGVLHALRRSLNGSPQRRGAGALPANHPWQQTVVPEGREAERLVVRDPLASRGRVGGCRHPREPRPEERSPGCVSTGRGVTHRHDQDAPCSKRPGSTVGCASSLARTRCWSGTWYGCRHG